MRRLGLPGYAKAGLPTSDNEEPFAITEHTIIPLVFSLIPLFLAIGLWRLNTTTRIIALVILWLIFLSAAINPWNPIYYIEFREKYHRIPDMYESILKSLPALIVFSFCIYALLKNKFEFGAKQTHIVETLGETPSE